MTEKPLKAVVFDLFHTLVDPEEFRPKEFHRAEVVADLLGLDRAKFFERYQSGYTKRMMDPRPDHEWLKEFVAEMGVTASDEALAGAEFALRRYQEQAIMTPRVDIVDSLKRIKKERLKLGLLSNCFEGEVRAWPRSQFAPLFDASVFSSEVGMVKPDEAIFRLMLDRLGVEASDAAFVGDGGSEELLGAKRVGFRYAVLTKRFVPANGIRTQAQLAEIEGQADFAVEDYADLIGRIKVRT